MKKLFLIIVMIGLVTSGCSPKLGSGDPSTPTTNQIDQPSQPKESTLPQEGGEENEGMGDKADDVLEDTPEAIITRGDVTAHPDVFVKPTEDTVSKEKEIDYHQKLVGLAWMIGGGLVFGTSVAADRIGTRLYGVFSKLQPGIGLQFREHRQIYNITLKAMEKFHIRKNVAKKILRKFMYAGSARALSMKRGSSKILQWLGKAGKVGGAVMSVVGVIEMVLEPTELADASITPQVRFEQLKRGIFSLEANPQDLYLQDWVLRSVIEYLPDFINSLKIEYNEHLAALDEAFNQESVSVEEKEAAQKEFNEFEVEQKKLIDFFQQSLETLSRLYYVKDADRSNANEILKENIQKLEQIFGEKE